MAFREFLFVTAVLAFAAAQTEIPNYPYDCRRSNAGCENTGSLCDSETGTCNCGDGFSGYDCGQQSTMVSTCADTSSCENNAVCTTDKGCFCLNNTYGADCSVPRLGMWCDGTHMFINIYPHGDEDFNGLIFVADKRSNTDCQLKAVSESEPDLAQYSYVQLAQGTQPTLSGYFIVLQHEADDPVCVNANKIERDDATDYLQSVVIEYNTVVISSLDQRIDFNCSIAKTENKITFNSGNAISVTIIDDDYQQVNVTEELLPIRFEIRDPDTGLVITNNVNLGDNLNLQFTLQSVSGREDTVKEFKVTNCTAFNSPSGTELPLQLEFLKDDCPTPDSSLAYRGQVTQNAARTQTIIPLFAFRFVGSMDGVSFTCTLKMCTQAMLDEDATACTKSDCLGDSTSDSTPDNTEGTPDNTEGTPDNTGGDPSGSPTDTSEGDASSDEANNQPAEGSPTPADAPPINNDDSAATTESETTSSSSGGRRKRSANEENNSQGEVTKTINVVSGVGKASTDKQNGKEGLIVEDEDCMQHSQVVIIIVIFSVVLLLLVVVVVVLGVGLLRSRKKVVDASDVSTMDTQSRYTLPRLSLATTM